MLQPQHPHLFPRLISLPLSPSSLSLSPLSVFMSVPCLYVCIGPCVSLSLSISVCLGVCLPACLSVYPCLFVSVCLSLTHSYSLILILTHTLSIYASTCLFIYPSACLSISLFIFISLHSAGQMVSTPVTADGGDYCPWDSVVMDDLKPCSNPIVGIYIAASSRRHDVMFPQGKWYMYNRTRRNQPSGQSSRSDQHSVWGQCVVFWGGANLLLLYGSRSNGQHTGHQSHIIW